MGRFRRANQLSRQTLADLLFHRLGDRASSIQSRGGGSLSTLVTAKRDRHDRILIAAWETPSRRCQPTEAQLERLAQLMQIDIPQLRQVLFPTNWALSPTTRLCAACYQAEPIHRRSWQRADLANCPIHQAPLLTQCPACRTALRLPSLWAIGRCERCWLPFEQMNITSGTGAV